MLVQPFSTADRPASPRAIAECGDARGGRLHALNMACLARLFARLEQLFQLWQAGALPVPTPRAPRRRTVRMCRRIPRRYRRTARRRPIRARTVRTAASTHVHVAPGPRPLVGRTPSPPPHPARAPPPRSSRKPLLKELPTHA